jgi:lysophospholipase L1-like esterase
MRPQITLETGQTILFIGDSITDADRHQPACRPFGYGYVHFVANMLLAKYPHLNINIKNEGVSGNVIQDLSQRWEKDCLAHKPDILSVLIGINDVWKVCTAPEQARGLLPDEYELTYKRLLLCVKQTFDCQLVLMEPFMFCSDPADHIFELLQRYIEKVDGLAREFDAVLVPLQSLINEQIKIVEPQKWSADSVHPYVWAHAWIAKCWLQATGL